MTKNDVKTPPRRFQGVPWTTLVRYHENSRQVPIGCYVGVDHPLRTAPTGWSRLIGFQFVLVNEDESKNIESIKNCKYLYLLRLCYVPGYKISDASYLCS